MKKIRSALLFGAIAGLGIPTQCAEPEPSPLYETPPKRAHHFLVYHEADERVIMTAGSTPLNNGTSFTFFNDLWAFDGTGWISLGVAGDRRSGIAIAYDSKEPALISMFGFSSTNQTLSDLRKLEGLTWKNLSNNQSLSATEGGFVFDATRDRFIAFGGSGPGGPIGDTWEWDRSAWNKVITTNPPARSSFAMVYDGKRQRTILFGGMAGTPQALLGDTWEYNGTTWSKVSDTGPSARMAMGFAFDSNRGQLIIFGGMTQAGVAGDTWAWDGTQWTKLSDAGPPARMMGHMAYDKKRDKVVLFGGRPSWPNDTNDTWQWDGTSWAEVK